jgi:hypothetical protein
MVTNPVDVLSRLFGTISGAPTYGIGSAIDTARCPRRLLGSSYAVRRGPILARMPSRGNGRAPEGAPRALSGIRYPAYRVSPGRGPAPGCW